jgi:hypothetical protein
MKELNLCEILKDAPKGTELYSPLYGEVTFDKLVSLGVSVKLKDKPYYKTISSNGKLYPGGEVMLYPSNDNRDWATFNPPRWRAGIGGVYYAVNMFGDISAMTDAACLIDDLLYNCGNYFRTESEAEESAIYKAFHPDK